MLRSSYYSFLHWVRRFSTKLNSDFLYFKMKRDPLIQSQLDNPLSIPILIINYNQLYYLKQLINFLIERKFQNIVIIDNQSNYPPLLDYYETVKDQITIEFQNENLGHKVFFKSKDLQQKYGKGYYVITDADIVPNKELPKDFMAQMLQILNKQFKKITKVGFALDLKSIPDYFPLKEKVLNHEQKFWETTYGENLYLANIDTTFALYKPMYPSHHNHLHRLKGIRIAGNFTAKHGGWYINPNAYTEENLHYIRSVDKSSSWKLNDKGQHDNKGKKRYD